MLTRQDLKLSAVFNSVGCHHYPHPIKNAQTPEERQHIFDDFAFMARLGITCVTVLNATPYVYEVATQFGMLVLNRWFRRAYQPYTGDGDPVGTAHRAGHAAIVQCNNEDELSDEWDGQPINWQLGAILLVEMSCQIYDQGGIVAWQMLDFGYFRYCVQVARERGAERIFQRFMFIPHNYGINHPPDYIQDENAFLGFLIWAEVLRDELGFVPLMIAGEMGWGLNEDKDNRYPKVTDELRTQYMMAVYDSFRTSILPDGSPLPDYFLAANRWILSSARDGGPITWEDDALLKGNGTRIESLIAAMEAMPKFVRKFSDDQPTPIPEPEVIPVPEPAAVNWRVSDAAGQQVGAYNSDQNALAHAKRIGGYVQPFAEPPLLIGGDSHQSEQLEAVRKELATANSHIELLNGRLAKIRQAGGW